MSIASFTPSRIGTIWLRNSTSLCSAAEYLPGSGGWARRPCRESATAHARIAIRSTVFGRIFTKSRCLGRLMYRNARREEVSGIAPTGRFYRRQGSSTNLPRA